MWICLTVSLEVTSTLLEMMTRWISDNDHGWARNTFRETLMFLEIVEVMKRLVLNWMQFPLITSAPCRCVNHCEDGTHRVITYLFRSSFHFLQDLPNLSFCYLACIV